MADVFVSYVSEDRARAATLAGALETTGYTVWWDRDLHGGADFAAEIERQLAAAAAVIVLWSTRSRDSQWVRDEASYARDANKLVPVRIDDGALPLGFRQLQSIELGAWAGDEADPAFTRLLTSLAHFVAEPRPAIQERSVKPRRTARAAWLGAAIAVCGAAGLAWWWLAGPWPGVAPEDDSDVSVQPISSPADGSLEGTANIVVNDLIRAFADIDVRVRGPSTSGAPDRARYRIEGDVQRTGDTAALSLQLTATDTGRIVWAEAFPVSAGAERFDRAAYVSVATQSAMGIEEWGKALPTRSSAARELWVQAFHEMNQHAFGERGSDLVAAQRLESALRIDPTFVEAHWLLAIIYSNRLGGTLRAEEAAPIAHEHVKKVVEHDPSDTHVLGQINLTLDLDYAAALANFERARGNRVPDMIIESFIGRVRFAQGNVDAALRHLQSADIGGSHRDTAVVALRLADVLGVAGRWDEARRAVDRALSLAHDASSVGLSALLTKVRIAHAQGDLVAASECLDRAWQAHGGERPQAFPGALARLGRVEEAKRILAEAEGRFQAGTLAYMTGAVEGAFVLGDLDRAFVWLDRAIDNRESSLFGHLRASPLFEPVRGDPRFTAAMKRLEALEAQGSRRGLTAAHPQR